MRGGQASPATSDEAKAAKLFDLEDACASLGLVEKETGQVWRFADATDPTTTVLEVHQIGRPEGGTSLKATCKRKGHGVCKCWVTKKYEGSDRLALLREYMQWGADGRMQNEQQHFTTSNALKRKHGMAPRKATGTM